ncbi:hypothetical protein REPUB_Repub15cG0086600 [Reevesia pubescens]
MVDSSEPREGSQQSEAEPHQSEQVCNFCRKPIKDKNIRKRTINEDEEDGDSRNGTSLLQNQKMALKPDNKLYFSAVPSKNCAAASESNIESDKPIFQFESSKEIQVQNDSRATATLETETEFNKDARAFWFRREQTVAGEKAGSSHGPLRASAHIRVSARFDYQPDICKDYKETGYCGYGDSWVNQSDDDDDDSLPFTCSISPQPFVDPVVTKCKHYFCEHCALKHHAKNKKCFVCNQPTLDIFNTAHEIRKKMAEESKR